MGGGPVNEIGPHHKELPSPRSTTSSVHKDIITQERVNKPKGKVCFLCLLYVNFIVLLNVVGKRDSLYDNCLSSFEILIPKLMHPNSDDNNNNNHIHKETTNVIQSYITKEDASVTTPESRVITKNSIASPQHEIGSEKVYPGPLFIHDRASWLSLSNSLLAQFDNVVGASREKLESIDWRASARALPRTSFSYVDKQWKELYAAAGAEVRSNTLTSEIVTKSKETINKISARMQVNSITSKIYSTRLEKNVENAVSTTAQWLPQNISLPSVALSSLLGVTGIVWLYSQIKFLCNFVYNMHVRRLCSGSALCTWTS